MRLGSVFKIRNVRQIDKLIVALRPVERIVDDQRLATLGRVGRVGCQD